MVTDADVLKRWKYIAQDDEKLLIIIGSPGSGKSQLIRELTYQDGWKICEARELFDDEFLEIPRADRPDKAITLVSAAIHRLNARVVMIDNVEFMFVAYSESRSCSNAEETEPRMPDHRQLARQSGRQYPVFRTQW